MLGGDLDQHLPVRRAGALIPRGVRAVGLGDGRNVLHGCVRRHRSGRDVGAGEPAEDRIGNPERAADPLRRDFSGCDTTVDGDNMNIQSVGQLADAMRPTRLFGLSGDGLTGGHRLVFLQLK